MHVLPPNIGHSSGFISFSICRVKSQIIKDVSTKSGSGFPQTLEYPESLDNENCHENIMEHEILAKSHEIL